MPRVIPLLEDSPTEVTAALTLASTRANFLVARELVLHPDSSIQDVLDRLHARGQTISKASVRVAAKALVDAGLAWTTNSTKPGTPARWGINPNHLTHTWTTAGHWLTTSD